VIDLTLFGLGQIMLMFAVGGMLGDVFLHLLPHLSSSTAAAATASEQHGHHEHHHHDGESTLSHLLGKHNDHDHVHHDNESMLLHLIKGELKVGLTVLAGFMFFFVVERLIRVATGSSHSHSHEHAAVGLAKKDDDLALKKSGSKSGHADAVHNGKQHNMSAAQYL
jgi:solute carrier family 39 (zinc transporter), member 7